MFINVDHPGENQKYLKPPPSLGWSNLKPNQNPISHPRSTIHLYGARLSFCLPPIGEYAKINVGNHFPTKVKSQQKIVQPPPRNTNPLHPWNFTIFEYIRKVLLFLNHGFWFPFVGYPGFILADNFPHRPEKLQKNSCLDGHTARLDGPAVGFPWCSELQG